MLEAAPGSTDMHLIGREKIAENFGERLSLRAAGVGAGGGREGGGEEEEGGGVGKIDMTGGAQVSLRIHWRLSIHTHTHTHTHTRLILLSSLLLLL